MPYCGRDGFKREFLEIKGLPIGGLKHSVSASPRNERFWGVQLSGDGAIERRKSGAVERQNLQMVVVVTTLLDAHEFPQDDLASLYRQRWQAELNLRSLKSVMQMDHLRCLTLHRARNEFYIHLLA